MQVIRKLDEHLSPTGERFELKEVASYKTPSRRDSMFITPRGSGGRKADYPPLKPTLKGLNLSDIKFNPFRVFGTRESSFTLQFYWRP